jgi:hypothetical protein
MINRRRMIKTALAVSALSVAGTRMISRAEALVPAIRPSMVIIDSRFDDAVEIAQQAAQAGAQLLEQPRDVLAMWYDEVLPSLTEVRPIFGGVTTLTGFFLFRTLAADHRLRVIYSAEHSEPANGMVTHVLTGSRMTQTQFEDRETRVDWKCRVSRVLSRCYAGVQLSPSVYTTPDAGVKRREPLVSWIIAPAKALT